jgi:hypothetical protein
VGAVAALERFHFHALGALGTKLGGYGAAEQLADQQHEEADRQNEEAAAGYKERGTSRDNEQQAKDARHKAEMPPRVLMGLGSPCGENGVRYLKTVDTIASFFHCLVLSNVMTVDKNWKFALGE